MAEQQATHRQGLEQTVVGGNVSNAKTGQILGFILALVGLLGGIYLLANGKSAEGYTSIISILVTLAGVFVYGRRSQQAERRSKAQNN